MDSTFWFFLSVFQFVTFIVFAGTCYLERNDRDAWF